VVINLATNSVLLLVMVIDIVLWAFSFQKTSKILVLF